MAHAGQSLFRIFRAPWYGRLTKELGRSRANAMVAYGESLADAAYQDTPYSARLADPRPPTPEQIAFVKALNTKFRGLSGALDADFRAYCGGRHGYVVRRFRSGCDPGDELSANRPIGMGPVALDRYFERNYGFPFKTFLRESSDALRRDLQGRHAEQEVAANSRRANMTKPRKGRQTTSGRQTARPAKKRSGAAAGTTACPPMNADGTRCTSPTCIRMMDQQCEKGRQTLDIHTAEGQLTEERRRLHDRIVEDIKRDRVCVPNPRSPRRRPVALLMGGAPGSGKSTFLKQKAPWAATPDVLSIDADAIRMMLPEYQGWNASHLQEETRMLVRRLIDDIGVPCTMDIVYDGTMSSVASYAGLIERLKALGYEVYIIHVQVPRSIAKKRVVDRYARSGRYVPGYVIDDFYQRGPDTFKAIRDSTSGWIQIDGVSGKTIASGGRSIPLDIDTDRNTGKAPSAQVTGAGKERRRRAESRRTDRRGRTAKTNDTATSQATVKASRDADDLVSAEASLKRIEELLTKALQ